MFTRRRLADEASAVDAWTRATHQMVNALMKDLLVPVRDAKKGTVKATLRERTAQVLDEHLFSQAAIEGAAAEFKLHFRILVCGAPSCVILGWAVARDHTRPVLAVGDLRHRCTLAVHALWAGARSCVGVGGRCASGYATLK